jgi:hypothetical protein
MSTHSFTNLGLYSHCRHEQQSMGMVYVLQVSYRDVVVEAMQNTEV